MVNKQLTYISLFSSAGVGCYGFKLNDYKCIATNELIEKRLKIQEINEKCDFSSGYILGDIKNQNIKDRIFDEIKKWQKLGNDRVDVIMATPPCQGMSVANHKKKDTEIDRNSLINESVSIIREINPRFFIFENVAAFWKTGCYSKDNEIIPIGDMILQELSDKYEIKHRIINFKNYGSNSSRTRTLVIGVDKKLAKYISPIELFPDYRQEKTLFEVIGDMPSLEWGAYDKDDFYHSFRTYPERMRSWIHDLKEGEDAFQNEDINKKPHKIVDNKIIINKSKNGDKYKRQIYNKVAPCIHTRNDQLASQNTVHPKEDRVFSIRELMKIMTIPKEFKWLEYSLEDLNKLDVFYKQKISKANEMNIRQSIGEAVPTQVIFEISKKIKDFMGKIKLKKKEIQEVIDRLFLNDIENLKDFVIFNKNIMLKENLSNIVELANAKRYKNSAFYTNKEIISEIFETLPDIKKDVLHIVEPSVGAGNFLPFIFKKYEDKKKVKLTVIDIDKKILEILEVLYSKEDVPANFEIEFLNMDFLEYNEEGIDLVVGNPPFTKLKSDTLKKYLKNNINKESTNLAEIMLEHAIKISDYVSFIMPKNILNTPEFSQTRKCFKELWVKSILDFGEMGFTGVLIETINLLIDTKNKGKKCYVKSVTNNQEFDQELSYIFDDKYPYWIIYRDSFFDEIAEKMSFDKFNVFRDRQITNSNSSPIKRDENDIRIIKSRNISDDGKEIIDIEGYDAYVNLEELKNMSVYKFFDDNSVYMTPNMTYKPRVMKKEKGYIVNGSVALLLPKDDFELTDEQMEYFSSDEFRKFYRIARNYQTRSLNVDKTSCFWFGALNK